MSDAQIKEARTIMRRVQEHLRQSHINMGAQTQTVGFVDVIYHDNKLVPALNYVMPRKNTAWVSGKHIENGLEVLKQKDRIMRVLFVEGLYPPVFLRALRDIGLTVEQEMPMMVFQPDKGALKTPLMPPQLTATRVNDQQGMAIWWYVWRNAFYDVATSGAEPLLIGRDMRDLVMGNQLDIILYRYGLAVGVARMTLHEGSAHIIAQAIMHEVRTPELSQQLLSAAVKIALENNCDMVFASGETDESRSEMRNMGFVDAGSVVRYAIIPDDHQRNEASDDSLAKPVLIV